MRRLFFHSWPRKIARGVACAAGCVVAMDHGRAQPLDSAFTPSLNAEVFAIAAQSDGKILCGGNFTAVGGVARPRLARLYADGSLDTAFNPAPNANVRAIRIQADGKILVGGSFTTVGGVGRVRLARLNADGTLDAAFTPGADNTVFDLALQPDGKILVTGNFTEISGVPRVGLARLNADGSLDSTFNVAISGTNTTASFFVETAVVQPDGRILFGGNFATVAGQPRNGAARVNAAGALDAGFNPNANSDVQGFAVLSDGRFYMVGSFGRLGTQTRNHIARFRPDGVLDDTFSLGTDAGVQQIAVQADGRAVIAGNFNSVGSTVRSRLARFNADGSIDSGFSPGVTGGLGLSSPSIYALALPAPGQIVIGGAFSAVSGEPRNGLARFGSPLPSIAVPPADVIAAIGANVVLSVSASGDALRYQWQRNGADIPGATGPTLALNRIQASAAGGYTAAVSNSFGVTTSAVAAVTIGPPRVPTYTFSTLAGSTGNSGNADGAGSGARFAHPASLALDPSGNLYVIDSSGLRRVTRGGAVTTIAPSAGQHVAVDATGNVYTLASPAIRKYAAGIDTIFAGSAVAGIGDGPGATARFSLDLRGIAADRRGNLYVSDTGGLAIRKITPAGVVSTLAAFAASGDVGAPAGIAVDAAGTVFFTDYLYGGVGRVTAGGSFSMVVRSLLLPGEQGSRLNGIAVDTAGNLFVTDVLNNVICRLDATGGIAAIAGVRGSRGGADGEGTGARFNTPFEVAVDAAGILYVADTGNHTIRRGVPEVVPLNIAGAPQSMHASAGDSVMLGVGANGPDLRFQWYKDGAPIPGATNATHPITRATAVDLGYYTVRVGSGGTTIDSSPALLTVATPGLRGRIVNVSTRGFVPAGGALTPGFVLRGTGGKRLVVRAVGPTLARFGVGGWLADPRMDLVPLGTGNTLLSNDDWGSPAAGAPALTSLTTSLGGFPLDPGAKDAAAIATLDVTVDRAYTVRITGSDATDSGIALAEVYDADPSSSPVELTNVSTRGFVGTGANALVPGFVIAGDGPKQVLIRAVGPGLAPFGVTGLLADPEISVTPLGRDFAVATNDNWTSGLSAAFSAVGAFALPADSKDAAVLVHLPPGGYTVVVSGVGGTTGTALVEIYDVP